MLPLLGAPLPLPRALDGEEPRERVELAVLRDDGPVLRGPPVAREELGHHAIAAAALPDEEAAGLEDARELADHARIVLRIVKEAEAREEVEHGVESPRP